MGRSFSSSIGKPERGFSYYGYLDAFPFALAY